jgi:hypothetical protein
MNFMLKTENIKRKRFSLSTTKKNHQLRHFLLYLKDTKINRFYVYTH